MKVKELIVILEKYNKEADVNIIVNGYPMPFEICIGSSEGCTPKTCDCVDFMIDTPAEKSGE
jgi:hypothetical protein